MTRSSDKRMTLDKINLKKKEKKKELFDPKERSIASTHCHK